MASGARKQLRRLMPTAYELVYDNYNALVFAFAGTERASSALFSLALYPRYVTIFFAQNALELSDPKKLLQGSGSRVRHIRLASAKDLQRPEIEALIQQTLGMAQPPLPTSGRGKTLVKSVSPRRRARQP